MENDKDLKNVLTEELIMELVDRGALLENTHVYGRYRLTKRYFLDSREDEKELHSRILILKDLKY